MCRYNKKLTFLQIKRLQYTRSFYLRQILRQHLIHGTTSLNNPIRAKTLSQQILTSNIAISKIDVSSMVNNLTVALLRNTLVETSVARLHMENRYMTLLCCNSTQA